MEKTPEKLVLEPKPALTDRVDQFWLERNEWKKINGGCAISPDLNATLKLLTENVRPAQSDLAGMIRATVEKRDKQGRKLEEIWAGKIAEGANFVGVVEGVFHFFKNEEILTEENHPLKISALPALLQFREKEKAMVRSRTREAMASLRANFQQSEFGSFVGSLPARSIDTLGEVKVEGGSDVV